MEELTKIQHLAGVSYVKWRIKEPEEFLVSSFTLDFTVSVWNYNSEFHPQFIFKGHRDVVTGYVLPPNEDFIITGSKDNFLIYQNFSNAYSPFEHCNKAGLSFDIEDFVVFRSEFQKVKNIDNFFIYLIKENKTIANKNLKANSSKDLVNKPKRKVLVYNSKYYLQNED
jgi:WD40 repeat protein